MSELTDVETELRKMQGALTQAGVKSGAKVCELAADIVRRSGKLERELAEARDQHAKMLDNATSVLMGRCKSRHEGGYADLVQQGLNHCPICMRIQRDQWRECARGLVSARKLGLLLAWNKALAAFERLEEGDK